MAKRRDWRVLNGNRVASFVAILIIATFARAKAEDFNDYPTSARADYVFGCMKANGETQELLQKCSCSIDVIASIIPYDRYVTAETILSMSQVTGPVGSEFRSTEPARLALQISGEPRPKRKFVASRAWSGKWVPIFRKNHAQTKRS